MPGSVARSFSDAELMSISASAFAAAGAGAFLSCAKAGAARVARASEAAISNFLMGFSLLFGGGRVGRRTPRILFASRTSDEWHPHLQAARRDGRCTSRHRHVAHGRASRGACG